MKDESSTVLNNLRTAHYDDYGLDLSSQEVHELWEDIEAKEIISSCMQILSSQEVHEVLAKDKDEPEPKPDPIEDALHARISELSQAVGLITTLKPTMVMDTEHPLDMAKEVVEYVTVHIAELEAEKQARRVMVGDRFPNKSGWYYAGCPRCGSMNITTAGVCANCGLS